MKKYNIIQLWEPIDERGNVVKPCFNIVGQLYGYATLSEAKAEKEKVASPSLCVIMKIWW